MFKKNTLLVLGAAVSHEVGMPLGSGLKKCILDALPSQNAGDRFVRGTLYEGPDFATNLRACDEIRTALPKAVSIDNLVEHRSGDAAFLRCAKVGIVAAILKSEAQSLVYRAEGATVGSILTADPSTYEALFQIIVARASVGGLEDAVRSVRVVNFNYDRCLEHYFHDWLVGYSGLDHSHAWRVVEALPVVRPYGTVGPLAKMSGRSSKPVPFGARLEGLNLNELAGNILTFSEERASETDDRVREYVELSEQIIFLGCAYHPQNLALLRPNRSSWNTAYGTCYIVPPEDKMSHPNLDTFSAPTAAAFTKAIQGWPVDNALIQAKQRIPLFEPLTCLQLTEKYRVEWSR